MNTIDKISTLDLLDAKTNATSSANKNSEFSKILTQSIDDVNALQEKGDKALADMATGEVKDLHQAALAINKAETSMKLMLEIRNKALNVYKEISKTQI